MWYENLDKNKFILNLYSEVPELIDVRIGEIRILEGGNRISLSFDMPCFPDNPPKKWVQSEYNTVNVQLDLFDIHELRLNANQKFYKGNIEIHKNEGIKVIIKGKIDAEISATLGMIQSVEGYINRI